MENVDAVPHSPPADGALPERIALESRIMFPLQRTLMPPYGCGKHRQESDGHLDRGKPCGPGIDPVGLLG
jgi:hypothetical protein